MTGAAPGVRSRVTSRVTKSGLLPPVLLLLAALLSLVAPAAASEQAAVAEARSALLAATNSARADRGLGALRLNDALAAAAQAHAEDMAARGYAAHVSPDGEDLADRVARSGYRYGSVGENLAFGTVSADATVAGWTGSDGHAANLYAESFTEVGMGYVRGPLEVDGARYTHVWVSVYGRPR